MILSEFLNLFKQGKVSAHSHMKNLIEIAMADGHFDVVEGKFLNELATKHGVKKKDLEAIKENKVEVKFVVPEDSQEKFNHLFELVHMMVIDNHIDREELKLCVIFAKKFGYNQQHCQELVDSIASNIRNGQTFKETQKRVNWIISN